MSNKILLPWYCLLLICSESFLHLVLRETLESFWLTMEKKWRLIFVVQILVIMTLMSRMIYQKLMLKFNGDLAHLDILWMGLLPSRISNDATTIEITCQLNLAMLMLTNLVLILDCLQLCHIFYWIVCNKFQTFVYKNMIKITFDF